MMERRAIVFFLTYFFAAGCAGPVYKQVFKEAPAANQKEFFVSREALYQAALKAVCSKNFLIEKEDRENGFILAKRYFQRGKQSIVLALQAKIVAEGENTAILFLNALETTERTYVSDHTRFFMWIVPLPGGGGKEASSIKAGEKIVEDPSFYKNFFAIISQELGNLVEEGSVNP